MNKLKLHNVPITLAGLNKNINFEIKRLIREKEDDIVKHVSTRTTLNGISVLVFKNKDGKSITLSYRHDQNGTLRFAREERFGH